MCDRRHALMSGSYASPLPLVLPSGRLLRWARYSCFAPEFAAVLSPLLKPSFLPEPSVRRRSVHAAAGLCKAVLKTAEWRRFRGPEGRCQFRKYCRYSVSLCAGRKPASRIIRRSSSSVVQFVAPAAFTTFSSSITEPTSLPPKRSPIWQTFSPCVTQLDCTLRKFDRYRREIANTFKYSTAVASSQCRPPSAVFAGWKLQGMNAVNPPVSSCNSYSF